MPHGLRDFLPWTGIKRGPPAVEAVRPNHGTSRKFPNSYIFRVRALLPSLPSPQHTKIYTTQKKKLLGIQFESRVCFFFMCSRQVFAFGYLKLGDLLFNVFCSCFFKRIKFIFLPRLFAVKLFWFVCIVWSFRPSTWLCLSASKSSVPSHDVTSWRCQRLLLPEWE